MGNVRIHISDYNYLYTLLLSLSGGTKTFHCVLIVVEAQSILTHIPSSFLHGGAWRDPAKLENIFDKSTQLILESSIKDSVAAVASIGYRLSVGI